MYSREIINMFFIGQVSWLGENLNIAIYSNTINVKNVKLSQVDNECPTIFEFGTYSRDIIDIS